MAVDHNNPQSRTEEILIATIDGEEYNKLPQSRLEELLLELKEVIEEGGGEGGLIQKIFLNGVEQEVVNKAVYLTVITNAVNDLVNYYLKTDTYSKLEVNNLIAAISTLHLQKVETLPTEDISQTTIYLVPKTTLLTNNVYDEYINTDGTSEGWELIGDTQIDLSDYVTFTDLEALLDDYVLATDLETALDSKVDKVVGKGLSTNDFTDEYKTAIGANTTAISGIKDGQSIDSFADVESALSDVDTAINGIKDGTDIDSFADVESALSDVDDDISTLKSGLTTLDNEVNGDATTYPYADVITIEDAVPSNLADCNVKIEPVQDLHGYDHPWVGGAGDNLCVLDIATMKSLNTVGTWNGNTYTAYDGTVEVQTDDAGNVTGIKVNGTFSTQNDFRLFGIFTSTTVVIPSGHYKSMMVKTTGNISLLGGYGTNVDFNDTTVTDFTTSDGIAYCMLRIAGGVAINDVVKPMICLSTASDPTVWSPYTNICPISGHTEASVQRDGKNLADGIVRPIMCGQNNVYVNTTLPIGSIVVPIVGGRDYTVSIKNAQTIFTSTCAEFPENGDTTVDVMSGTSGASVTHKTVSTSANAKYLVVHTGSHDYEEFQVELGSTATPYVPYAGKTYTISLGDTIYGGTVDFDTGLMTVTHGIYTENDFGGPSGTSQGGLYIFYKNSVVKEGTTPICNMLGYGTTSSTTPCVGTSTGTQLRLYLNESTQEAMITAYSGLQVVCELATPTTIQLTPQQIQLLKGQNTLTASTGDISVTVNGVSGAIGAVQEQVNATDEALAELADKLPTAPTTDGAYVLTVTVADGTPTYSWESAT